MSNKILILLGQGTDDKYKYWYAYVDKLDVVYNVKESILYYDKSLDKKNFTIQNFLPKIRFLIIMYNFFII